jgi:hypothetical protein
MGGVTQPSLQARNIMTALPNISNGVLNAQIASMTADQIVSSKKVQAEIAKLPAAERQLVHDYVANKRTEERSASNEMRAESRLDKADKLFETLSELNAQKDSIADSVKTKEERAKHASALMRAAPEAFDGFFNQAELHALAQSKDPEIAAAAKFFLADSSLKTPNPPWNDLVIRTDALQNAVNSTASEVNTLREQARRIDTQIRSTQRQLDRYDQPPANNGSNSSGGASTSGNNGTNGANGSGGTNGANGSGGTNGANGSGGTNGANGSGGTNGPKSEQDLRAEGERQMNSGRAEFPPSSNAPGMGGAIQNLTNAIDWYAAENARLASIIRDPKASAAAKDAAQLELDKTRHTMQKLMDLLKELANLRSNMTKVFADINSHIINKIN